MRRVFDIAFYVAAAYTVGRLHQRQLAFERELCAATRLHFRDVEKAFSKRDKELLRWLRETNTYLKGAVR